MNNRSWHNLVLYDGDLALRPIRESDWEFIYRWCNDPEVLYFTDGFQLHAEIPRPDAGVEYDICLSRKEFYLIN